MQPSFAPPSPPAAPPPQGAGQPVRLGARRLFHLACEEAIADGVVDARENAFLQDLRRRLGIDLALSRTIARSARDTASIQGTGDALDPRRLFRRASVVACADGVLTAREKLLLGHLGTALGLDQPTARRILAVEWARRPGRKEAPVATSPATSLPPPPEPESPDDPAPPPRPSGEPQVRPRTTARKGFSSAGGTSGDDPLVDQGIQAAQVVLGLLATLVAKIAAKTWMLSFLLPALVLVAGGLGLQGARRLRGKARIGAAVLAVALSFAGALVTAIPAVREATAPPKTRAALLIEAAVAQAAKETPREMSPGLRVDRVHGGNRRLVYEYTLDIVGAPEPGALAAEREALLARVRKGMQPFARERVTLVHVFRGRTGDELARIELAPHEYLRADS